MTYGARWMRPERPLAELIDELWREAQRKRAMPCKKIETPIGTIIACSRGGNRKCAVCNRPAPYLCDYPVTIQLGDGAVGRTTCDKPLCGEHAKGIGGGKHHCYDHPRLSRETSQAKPAEGP